MTEKPDPRKPDPWRVPVAIAQIPDTGLHRDLKADETIRQAIADVGDLREVLSAQASLDVTPTSGGRYHVAGHVLCLGQLGPRRYQQHDEAVGRGRGPWPRPCSHARA